MAAAHDCGDDSPATARQSLTCDGSVGAGAVDKRPALQTRGLDSTDSTDSTDRRRRTDGQAGSGHSCAIHSIDYTWVGLNVKQSVLLNVDLHGVASQVQLELHFLRILSPSAPCPSASTRLFALHTTQGKPAVFAGQQSTPTVKCPTTDRGRLHTLRPLVLSAPSCLAPLARPVRLPGLAAATTVSRHGGPCHIAEPNGEEAAPDRRETLQWPSG